MQSHKLQQLVAIAVSLARIGELVIALKREKTHAYDPVRGSLSFRQRRSG